MTIVPAPRGILVCEWSVCSRPPTPRNSLLSSQPCGHCKQLESSERYSSSSSLVMIMTVIRVRSTLVNRTYTALHA
jgi:hypothetical protein